MDDGRVRAVADAVGDAHIDYLEAQRHRLQRAMVFEAITFVLVAVNLKWGPWWPLTVVVLVASVALSVATVRSITWMRRYRRLMQG
jgi:hypothetical protein